MTTGYTDIDIEITGNQRNYNQSTMRKFIIHKLIDKLNRNVGNVAN